MPSASNARMRAACASVAVFVQAVRHRQRLAVIGDRDVLEPSFPRRFRHRPEVVFPVGFRGVHVEIAAQVGPIDKPRQPFGQRRLDFAVHLP